ncbi:MAG: L-lactate permease, partial [Planctomycetia bacterium]
MAGGRGLVEVWPAVLICGGSFAAVQFIMANSVGAALVDVVAGIASLVALAAFLRCWQPRTCWRHGEEKRGLAEKRGQAPAAALPEPVPFSVEEKRGLAHHAQQDVPVPFLGSARAVVWAWSPWAFLSIAVFCWGLPAVKATFEGRHPPARAGGLYADGSPERERRDPAEPLLPKNFVAPEFPVPRLDGRVAKVPPATREPQEIERAVYRLNWLSAAGTGILAAALVAVPWLGIPWRRAAAIWIDNLRRLALSLVTIALMLALAFVTRYSGTDVTLGLALTRSGWLYPFFAPLLGWLGVALTGSDTSSNAMFGSLQRVTAEQLGLDPLLICTSNSTGGVMGKMIDAQSIVVSATATGEHRQEGTILRRVFPHSLALA